MSFVAPPASTSTSCPACGAFQADRAAARGAVLVCGRCDTELERTTGRSLDAALACAAATLLMLGPANLLPFLTTSTLGVSRESRLLSSAHAMWGQGFPLLGVVIALLVVVAPIMRFGLLTAVLGALRSGLRPRWLGRAFRTANALQTWAMVDVFLLGLWIAHARLSATIFTTVGAGAQCFIAAGVLSLCTRAALDKAAVWRLISPDAAVETLVGAVSCPSCELVLPGEAAGARCPRCAERVHARGRNSVARAAALTLAGAAFYLPANIYPMATLPIGLKPESYTVLQGVGDLMNAKLLGLAALVFTASFAIPLLKLGGMAVLVHSVRSRSTRGLKLKTRLYTVIDEIGRWSMVDPFVIACFVPVTGYNALLYGRAEPAAPCFTAVVVLTVLAARQFDPRLLWDAAGARA